MGKDMGNEMERLAPRPLLSGYIGHTQGYYFLPVMENGIQKQMENDMETGVIYMGFNYNSKTETFLPDPKP